MKFEVEDLLFLNFPFLKMTQSLEKNYVNERKAVGRRNQFNFISQNTASVFMAHTKLFDFRVV